MFTILTSISHGLLLQDICFLTNGDPPAWLPSSLEMELSLGLELLEAVLRGYPRVFVKVCNTSLGTMGVVDSHTHSNTYCEERLWRPSSFYSENVVLDDSCLTNCVVTPARTVEDLSVWYGVVLDILTMATTECRACGYGYNLRVVATQITHALTPPCTCMHTRTPHAHTHILTRTFTFTLVHTCRRSCSTCC